MNQLSKLWKCGNKDQLIEWLINFADGLCGVMVSEEAVDEYLHENDDPEDP